VHKLKKIAATPKLEKPEGWHKARSTLRANKY